MPALLEVAAGLVFRDGKLLVTQRPVNTHLGGLWEFPGGKREPAESFPECLQRELREELAIEVEVGALIEELTHDYGDRSVLLRFYQCRWLRHEPQPLHCQALAWITADELSHYQFPAADARLLSRLRAEWNAIDPGPSSA